MTVKNITEALKDATKISLAFDGLAHSLDFHSSVMMEAFGSYVVSGIRGGEHGEYELEIAMRPVKATD